MATVTVSELNQQTARVLERVKNGEPVTITEYGRPIARLVPDAPLTGVPILDEMIAQGRAIPASRPWPIPPTPVHADGDADLSVTERFLRDREDERY